MRFDTVHNMRECMNMHVWCVLFCFFSSFPQLTQPTDTRNEDMSNIPHKKYFHFLTAFSHYTHTHTLAFTRHHQLADKYEIC